MYLYIYLIASEPRATPAVFLFLSIYLSNYIISAATRAAPAVCLEYLLIYIFNCGCAAGTLTGGLEYLLIYFLIEWL